jgi:hypothetical protein
MTQVDPGSPAARSLGMERPDATTIRHDVASGPHLTSCEEIRYRFCASLSNGRGRCPKGTCFLDDTLEPVPPDVRDNQPEASDPPEGYRYDPDDGPALTDVETDEVGW